MRRRRYGSRSSRSTKFLLSISRNFVERLERLPYLLRLIHEVQDEGVLLASMNPIQARQRLHRLNVSQALVHIHRVEQRLVEAGLVLVRDNEHLVQILG